MKYELKEYIDAGMDEIFIKMFGEKYAHAFWKELMLSVNIYFMDEPASQINMYRIDTDKRMTVGPGGLLIGEAITHGKGARGKTAIGEKAAREHKEDIQRLIIGAGMVIIIAGTDGGTSTGAAPVIAEISTDMGIPTFAVLYEPFGCVGQKRMDIANKTIETLSGIVYDITIIPDDEDIPDDKDDTIFGDVQKIIDKYY